ncbi:MAG: F0F1 ATP synthase subunit gamma [Candidatus Chromulinivorax sp.]
MSQLIQIKQRIKAITVIKKITHAMRLISMSSRMKMLKNSENLHHFKNELSPLLCSFEKFHTNSEIDHNSKKDIFILIGSEKGLCGNFNNLIFYHFEQEIQKIDINHYNFIAVGKQACDYLAQKNIKMIARFDKLSANQLEKTAHALYEFLLEHKDYHRTVTCFYNRSKTFFIQEPYEYQLLPVKPQENCSITNSINLEEYHWIQQPEDVLACLFQSFLKLNVLFILSQSLIAEQSARFLSMDSSTRNAENLLKKMKLEYNKIRQAKITRELAELMSSF